MVANHLLCGRQLAVGRQQIEHGVEEELAVLNGDLERVDLLGPRRDVEPPPHLRPLGLVQVELGHQARDESALLVADLEVTGHPRVVLYVAADAADAGVFVYLEDVAPDGRVEYVTEGMLRALHRKTTGAPYRSPVPYRSFTRADGSPLVPGEPAILEIALYPTSYQFKAGHAIRLAVAGADVDHFAPVEPSPTALRIHRGDPHPSRIVLPTMPRRSTP